MAGPGAACLMRQPVRKDRDMRVCVTASRGAGPENLLAQSGSDWRSLVAERGSGSKRSTISAGALHSIRFFNPAAGNR